MLGTQKLLAASSQLLRQSAGLNRAQWRSVQRQWHRQLSQTSSPIRPRIAQQLRSQRRYNSSNADQAKKPAEETASTAKAKAHAIKAGAATANTGSRFIAYVYGTGLVLLLSFGYLYVTDTRASIHQFLVTPLVRLIHSDAEEAHHAGVRYIKALHDFGLAPRERGNADKALADLKVEVFGHILDNPIGTSAGIDKDAEIPDALFALGPAIVEVGGATPLPQEGNPKPRVFRIPSQNALINRYGLNSQGAEHVAMQLRARVRQFAYDNGLGLEAESEQRILDGEAGVPPGSLNDGKLLAVQVAKNKTTPDNDIAAVAADYVFCVEHLAQYADILVVNVSSPNTPGLRDLQATKPLTQILSSVVEAAKSVDRKTKPAVMVKVSPDEDSDAQMDGICTAVWASGVDGVIVGNTTKKRPEPIPKGYIMPADDIRTLTEVGGYSGPQMFERTLNLVKRYRFKLDQGPAESGNTQKAVQSPLDPLERGLTGEATPENAQKHATKESIERDQQRLKPLTDEAEAASKRPLIQLPVRHTSEELEKDKHIGQAQQRASTQTTDAAGSENAVQSGRASSPREAAEGAVQKVISVGESAASKTETTTSNLKSDIQSASSEAKAKAESAADNVSSRLESATSSAKSSLQETTSSSLTTAQDLASRASTAASSAAQSAKQTFNHVTSDPYAEISAPKVTPSIASQGNDGDGKEESKSKVIFATGGITNGEQCLQILNAGASVCQVYTAMMYGGVGTITRMKGEMRDQIHQKSGKVS
ncbi:Putative dihydroorotate dehydrogenase, aldolase-type TIM barrel [Septoria linicola]|uniref:Dihydroorotate dehydrogenase (quinone), mitochondrial n=1 Tax=Septoria linicola TaxID=215465 RepID=A0A9Q9B0L6_9PEZI|nr:Putative dihydroorotate dehydrogenase, aldolase-type TIM barrel [Septoria linicola]